MDIGALGKTYKDGDWILRQGDVGDCMYVIQSGQVEIVRENEGREIPLAIRREGEFFGEMALFSREVRVANVRAQGTVRVLTVDRKNLLRRIQEDPTLAFRIIEGMSHRIRELSEQVVERAT